MITNQETSCMFNMYLCTSKFHKYSSMMGAGLHLLKGAGLNPKGADIASVCTPKGAGLNH